MYCSNCGSAIPEQAQFCPNCGAPRVVQGGKPFVDLNKPQDPTAVAATVGGVASITGGALAVLGWFMPWISLPSVARSLLSAVDSGASTSFVDVGSIINMGLGVGNGLQLFLFSLTAGVVALFGIDEMGVLLILSGLLFLFAAFMLSIPILAVSIFRAGLRTFTRRSYDPAGVQVVQKAIYQDMQGVRGKSATIFSLLAVIFILAAALPFVSAVLGGGYYLTILGVVVAFAGAVYTQTKV